MNQHKNFLFTMDLRIDKEIVKLKVYEEDLLNDLIDRLTVAIHWKTISKDKVKTKLEDQFKKITLTPGISQKAKNKLESLLEESKFIIVAIETDKNDTGLNQTPFKILQDSVNQARRKSEQKYKRHYQYLNKDEYNTETNYGSKELSQEIRKDQYYLQPQFQKVMVRSKKISPQKLHHQTDIYKKDDSSQIFQKKYEEIDRKCQNFISKHLGIPQNYKVYRQPYQSSQPKPVSNFESAQPQRYYEEYNTHSYDLLVRQNQQRLKNQHQNGQYPRENQRILRSRSGNEIKCIDRTAGGQSFQQYKINRYKSNHNLHPIDTHHDQNYRVPSYRETKNDYNRQNLRPSKSYARLKGRIDYNNTGTIRSYDTGIGIEKRSNDGTVSYKRLKGRYNYLCQENNKFV